MDRRRFLTGALVAASGGAVGAVVPGLTASAQNTIAAVGPYGPIQTTPDENGLRLPIGFRSRIVATAGEAVAGTDYEWPIFPDGAATFAVDDGGWILVVNSEVWDGTAPDAGGVSAVRFDVAGKVVDAYSILRGSNSNCAGGPTPWGTWLSCEENGSEKGRVWECDPTGAQVAVAHEAMGLWAHEAAAVDPESGTVYLTQDHPEGLLYRYTPTSYPDLSQGQLEACVVGADGAVTWGLVPDPSGASAPTRTQVAGATVFPGTEGIWYHDGWIWFTAKYDHTVHGIDLRAQRHTVLWKGDPEGLGVEGAVLSGVDNITVGAASGDLYVAEDGGNMEVVMIGTEGTVAPFARLVGDGHDGSEVTGPCFDPSGRRLYFSSQRGPTPRSVQEIVPGAETEASGAGITYEVTGPFRLGPGAGAVPDTLARVGALSAPAARSASADGDGWALPGALGAAGLAGVAAVAGTIAVRRRRL